ncbi:segregation and condensation protein A [Streptomyces sp. URMC 123]|uniref:segregation and condensation protein A n=1 Tax=Streptomyces sp. URMC 123 TaxID=3423403 RepID=UPI003F1C4915
MSSSDESAPRGRLRRALGRGPRSGPPAGASAEAPAGAPAGAPADVHAGVPAGASAEAPAGGGGVAGSRADEAVPARESAASEPEAVGPRTAAEARGASPAEAAEPVAVPARESASAGDSTDAQVAEGEGGGRSARRARGEGDPGATFTVRLDNFEGPFDLLLQLIAKHKMDVTEIALSRVTDEFMAHIRAAGPDWDLDRTTEFLVVAATLLDLKTARLLPAAEVEDEADLALLEARDLLFARLLQYRAFKRVAEILQERFAAEARRHPRTVGLEPHHAELLPEVVLGIGAEGFARLAVRAMRPRPKPQVYVDHIHAPLVSVREQAEVVIARLRAVGEASFQELAADAPDTLTVVARFLALLELYRERAVALTQEEALGSLLVRWTGGEGEGAPVVTDEFDQEPGAAAAAGDRRTGPEEPADGAGEEESAV